jgi:hypothetical protein
MPQTGMPFVSFGAAYEGPAFAQGVNGLETNVVGGGPITSDDLAICEDCIRSAAAEVGLGDVSKEKAEAAELQAALERLSDRLAALDEHAANVEQALASRVKVDELMQPAKPQPRAKTKARTR